MDTKDLELAVHNIIQELYNKEYTGKLEVRKLKSGYLLLLYLDLPDSPTTYMIDGTSEQFLNYIKKELKKSGWNRIEFSTLKKLYFTNGCCKK